MCAACCSTPPRPPNWIGRTSTTSPPAATTSSGCCAERSNNARLEWNVLLHGPPGTGKTEFCKTLAERLGVTLYSVGETDEDGDEASRRQRLQELRLAQRLVSGNESAILLFDEMEDLLESHAIDFGVRELLGGSRQYGRTNGSKVFMNRLLEQAPTPTLWTTNSAPAMRPSLLRRMMFALEMGQPPAPVRERIWARQLARHGIACEQGRHARARHGFRCRAGSGGWHHGRGGAVAAVAWPRCAAASTAWRRLLRCEKPPQSAAARFDPALSRADVDLVAFSKQLVASGETRFSLCLQGPPGTGKSALARHLAESLGLEVEQKRASDLAVQVGGRNRTAHRQRLRRRPRPADVPDLRRSRFAARGPAFPPTAPGK